MYGMQSRRSFFKLATGAGIAAAAGIATGGSLLRDAFAQNGDTELRCNSNGVRIRSKANLSGTIVGTLNRGDIVNLTGAPVSADGYEWLPITARSGRAGFAAANFFDVGQGGWSVGTRVYVATDSLRLRKEASASSAVVGTYPRGTEAVTRWAPVSRDGYTWYGVTLNNGTQGFFAGEFLAKGSSPGPAPDPGGGNGFAAGTVVQVADGPLNLRRSAGTGSGVIKTYASGARATVISGPTSANGHRWYKVEVTDGNVGYWAEAFIRVAASEPTGMRLRVTNGPLRLRKNPGLASATLASIPTGATVTVADASSVRQDGYLWRYVRLDSNRNLVGWIADGFTETIG